MKKQSFTLIELLVTVTIVGLLAMIVINLSLNAKVRAEVARVQTDFRSIGEAFSEYWIDHSTLPGGGLSVLGGQRYISALSVLTTPIAYLNVLPASPWDRNSMYLNDTLVIQNVYNSYQRRGMPFDLEGWKESWIGGSDYHYFSGKLGIDGGTYDWLLISNGPTQIPESNLYDSTNGIISLGRIWRLGVLE